MNFLQWLLMKWSLFLFFYLGDGPKDVVRQYSGVTGTPAKPQLFAHQSRQNYRDWEDVQNVDSKFDEHDIPYDVVWLNIEHTDGKKYFTGNRVFFPVFIGSMVLPMFPPYGKWLDNMIQNTLMIWMPLRWILCNPVQFIIDRRFYVESYHALRQKFANMDVLVALGSNTVYFYCIYVIIKALISKTFEGTELFETSSMLISFILLGKYLEVVAKGRTSDVWAKLMNLICDTSRLLTYGVEGNVISEIKISTQVIPRDDILTIVPVSKIPVDGIIVGGSHVNESMIIGEARPFAKTPGVKVIGGTVYESGWVLVKDTQAKPSFIAAAEIVVAALANLLSHSEVVAEALTEDVVLVLTRVLGDGSLEGKKSESRALLLLLRHFPEGEVLTGNGQCRFIVLAIVNSLNGMDMDMDMIGAADALDIVALLCRTKQSMNFTSPPWSALVEVPSNLDLLVRCLAEGPPLV